MRPLYCCYEEKGGRLRFQLACSTRWRSGAMQPWGEKLMNGGICLSFRFFYFSVSFFPPCQRLDHTLVCHVLDTSVGMCPGIASRVVFFLCYDRILFRGGITSDATTGMRVRGLNWGWAHSCTSAAVGNTIRGHCLSNSKLGREGRSSYFLFFLFLKISRNK